MDTSVPHNRPFALNPGSRATMQRLGGKVPVLLIDDVFAAPTALRALALALPYGEPNTVYPGKIAETDGDDPSLQFFLGKILELVNEQYLPRVPPLFVDGQPIARFKRIHADFAVTDRHPDDLEATQRKPHIDPVAIFGLVYLNPEPKGGTLFFEEAGIGVSERSSEGYCTGADLGFSLVGRIEGIFNRLAIYPGFILHSGEIEGAWIRSDERFRSPRLTLRLAFIP